MVSLLERRLDATALRAGFTRTIYQARQLVAHGHFQVDGTKVDRPSYRLKPGQVVTVKATSRAKPPFELAAAGAHLLERSAPYLSTAIDQLRTTLVRTPARTEIPVLCEEQLVEHRPLRELEVPEQLSLEDERRGARAREAVGGA